LTAARTEIGYEARKLVDDALVDMGEVMVEIMETPGHTPEHISLVIRNRSRSEEPMILFSGGALLVGDVGRPDLLGDQQVTRWGAHD
jgi:hydroxyacylglutathione hydrolase